MNKLLRLSLSVALFTLVSFTLQAQYLADDTCTTPFEDISTTGTSTLLADDAEIGITIPFSFVYYGNASSDLTIGNNGGIVFNTLTGQVGA